MTAFTLADMRNHIAADLGRILGDKVLSCEPHGGRFDEEEMRRTITRAPCVRVAIDSVGALKHRMHDSWEVDVGFRLYIVGTDKTERSRDESALDILTAVLLRIAVSNWGKPAQFQHIDQLTVGGLSLFSRPTDQAGVALWEVSWQQRCILTL